MTTSRKAVIVLGIVAALTGVRAAVNALGSPFRADTPPPTLNLAAAHLDHSPRHGGLVLMNEDTHFEVLVDAGWSCRVYFTDAVRKELPPAYASKVSLAIAGGPRRQAVALKVDRELNAWVGNLEPVEDPNAIVRVFYETRGERPYWIDLLLSSVRGGVPMTPPTPR